MRRAMLLTLVAMALPTAALATSINFMTGTFEHGKVTRESSGKFTAPSFTISVTGKSGTITITTNTLGAGCDTNIVGECSFSSGTITVKNSSGSTVFTDSLKDGLIFKGSGGASVVASLVPSSMAPTGGITGFTVTFLPGPNATDKVLHGTAFAESSVIPEPSALLLLGTGVVGLAGIMRRKLRQDTRVRIS
jgi:hypothetical protein